MVMHCRTLPIILEYCGGEKTDLLFEKISASNREYPLQVLDNASPGNASRYITVRNQHNSFIGGGLCDCLDLAEKHGADFLFFISNDIEIIRVPLIRQFESLAVLDKSVAVIGASITSDSLQAKQYPWMIDNGSLQDRMVRHYDPLCCLIRISFVRAFGGFPLSVAGWGYDWELASYARFCSRKILVSDKALIRHDGNPQLSNKTLGESFNKWDEMAKIYDGIYGDYRLLFAWQISQYIPELHLQFGPQLEEHSAKRRLSDKEIRNALTRMREEIPRLIRI
jgi:hypothetical protein